MEKLELLDRSQISDSILTTPTSTGWRWEGTPPPPAPTGRPPGGIHLKVTVDLEDKRSQGQMTVFIINDVPLRCPTRLRLALTHQE